MTIQITVGDAGTGIDPRDARGTVTAGLAVRRDADKERVMIELTAASGPTKCAVQLTVGEAEVLHGALDSIIFDAALRSGESTKAGAATTQ